MHIHKLKVVIFDYDDTLVKSSQALYKTDCKTAETLGLEKPTRSAYFSLWGKPHKEMINILHPGIDVNIYMKKYSEIYHPDSLELFKDAKDILETLTKRGLRIALLSAKQKKFLEEHLKHASIRKYFDYIHSVKSSPYKKPDPKVFNDLINHFGLDPSEMLYIGDQVLDYETASKAGLHFFAVTTGINTEQDFKNAGCNNIVSSLNELLNKLS